ncbi:hypothetical protein BG000_001913 [Podila horticola]|nr:hypothetical protein BG003_004448 [Podila horticola]KAG0325145.1 hypothetical protein BG000_001913 [Podila horticola]
MAILSIFKKSSAKSSDLSGQPPPYSVVDTHPSSSSTPRSSFSQDSAFNAQRHQNQNSQAKAKPQTFKPSAMSVAMSRI